MPSVAGAATKVRAQQILTGARNEVSASAHAAQEILDELSVGLPDGRWHVDQIFGGIGDWVTGIAGLVATFTSYRALVEPVGVHTDAREIGAAVYAIPGQLADDPVGTTETLLDVQTLRDNPGRWSGRVAPDLAIGVATAGVGLAARSGRLGVAATRVVDEVADAADSVGAASAAEAPTAAPGFDGLLSHEAAGGHTLSKHVGLTAEDLADRLATSRVPTVSSFTNREIAEAAIAEVLEANRPAISAWLARGAAPTDSVFTGIDANPVGTVLRPGATVPVVSHAVRVILRAEPRFPGGFRIQTAYPE